MIVNPLRRAFFCALLGVCMASIARSADWKSAAFYQIRGGIPNSQYYFQADISGNQYLFFLGDSVLAGTGLKNQNLRYSAQMVKGFRKYFQGGDHRDAALAAGRKLVRAVPREPRPGRVWRSDLQRAPGDPGFRRG